MSDDLIRRSAVLESLKKVFEEYGISYGSHYGGFAAAVPKAIEKMPTAYDVDKVVEKIQNIHMPLASQTARIISIVKAGGVNE